MSALLVAGLLVACGDQPVEPDPPRPATVSVVPSTVSFAAAGETVQLTAQVTDQYGNAMSGVSVNWSSSNAQAATVDQSGLVTAVGDGETTITAQAGNASGSAMVTVVRAAASVSVEPDTVVFASARDTARVTATVFDANGHVIEGAPLAWTSGDSLVATITPDGLLTAVGGGETTVGVVSGTAQARVLVRVALVADSIVVAPAELTFAALGEGASLSATVLDANGNPIEAAEVEWATADDLVATVDASGVVTAAGNGATSIVASIGFTSSAVRVIVAQAAARIVPASTSLFLTAVGDTAALYAEGFDSNGHRIEERSVTWTSSDPSVASADGAGLVAANGFGRAELTARMDSVEASVEVEVLEILDDRGVLELLYRTTGGEGWSGKTNWLTRRPISEWHGVEVDGQGRVTHLRLSANNLAGPLHPVVGKLEGLVLLDLSANELSGTIPSALGQLKNLEFLWLSDNRFEGPLPPELGALESIVEIVIGYNQLSGPIPPEWGELTTLQDLSMQGNRLSGPLPPEIGDMAALQWLVLFSNEISGPIPPEIGNMSELRRLQLADNQLSGPIPPEVGRLQVEMLDLQQNRLSGSIPPELSTHLPM